MNGEMFLLGLFTGIGVATTAFTIMFAVSLYKVNARSRARQLRPIQESNGHARFPEKVEKE